MYSISTKTYELKEILLQKVSQEVIEKEFPSYTIGHSKECLDVFLDVLKTSNV